MAEEGERKDRIIQQKESQLSLHGEEVQAEEKQKTVEIYRLKLVHSSEVEQLQSKIRDLNTQNQLLKAESEAGIKELEFKVMALEIEVENKAKTLLQKSQEFEMQLAREREEKEELTTDKHNLQSKYYVPEGAISKLETKVAEYESSIQMKDASAKRKDSEIEAKSRALKEKDATIPAMSEQLSKTRELLATKRQVSMYTIYDHSNTAKNERLFQPSFGYLSFMPLCSASLNTRESHWLLYIPNSNGQFVRTLLFSECRGG